jgi:hypothetical protein
MKVFKVGEIREVLKEMDDRNDVSIDYIVLMLEKNRQSIREASSGSDLKR